VFDAVYPGEPKSKPTDKGLHLTIFFNRWQQCATRSGLSVTSIVAVWNLRVGLPMLAQSVGEVERQVVTGTDRVVESLNGDFTLGGLVAGVDIFGMSGIGMSGRAGYLNHDGTLFRVINTEVPLLFDDVWEQTP
jgi:hypothetical protein